VVELKALIESKNEVKFEFPNLDLGLANLVAQELLEDKSVEYAAASYSHPLERRVIIHVKAPNARKALEKAVKQTALKLAEVEKALK